MAQAFVERLRAALPQVALTPRTEPGLMPAMVAAVAAADWAVLATAARDLGARWSACWVDPEPDHWRACVLYEQGGAYVLAQTTLDPRAPRLSSLASVFAAADRSERAIRDLLGVVFDGHSDARRWLRHQAWPASAYPLRPDAAVAGAPPPRTPADVGYPFRKIAGDAVHEVAVGPIHAGTIEPGHFRFATVGEQALTLETRLGYVHRGVEKIAVGRDAAGLLRLAARVSGDSTVAHTWAACMAMERAAGCAVSPRALALRGLLAERERVANHLGDVGAIAGDVGFSFAQMQFGALRERWQRRSAERFGHRLLMDTLCAGGVRVDLDPEGTQALLQDHARLRAELAPLTDILLDHPSLEDRLVGTGVLAAADARALGCLGYLGRASGQAYDLRRDAPYPPYDRLPVRVPLYDGGDVAARMRVRLDEIVVALELMDALLAALPPGPTMTHWEAPPSGAPGLGLVEGWRGETLAFVRFGADGRIARYAPRDPSVFAWPALERLLPGNIVPDFPVCNKSVNGSYAGGDL